MATELLFQIAAGVLLLSGVFVAWSWGWRDKGRGTRRCPKCWYDMTATAGLKCSECGREACTEKQLHRSNRKWRYVALGAVLVLASYPIFKWPLYLKDGPIGFVPRTVVFALLPEVSEQIRARLPPNTPRGVSLAMKLAARGELSAVERSLLARSFDRILRSPKTTGPEVLVVMQAVGLLGDCAPIVMPRLAEILAGSSFSYELWPHLRSLPRNEGCRALMPVVLNRAVAIPQSIEYWPLLEMIRAWGANDEEMRSVLVPALRSNRDGVEWRVLSCMWTERLARPEDVPELIRKGFGPKHPTEYATWMMASLPPKHESVSLAGEQIRVGTPANFIKACTILVGAGQMARAALPELEAAGKSPDESTRVAARFTAACLRGEAAVAVETIERIRGLDAVAGKYGSAHGVLFLGLVFYSPLANSEKRAFLEWRIARDLPTLEPTSAPVTLELAVIMLGHMGEAASDAVPRLLELCRPQGMRPIRIAAIDAIVQIGLSNSEQMERAEEVLREWHSQKVSAPEMQMRLERLKAAIAKGQRVASKKANQ
ncbi:MAG: hypothetical protein JNM86_14800 [Phycisphaerae bacterium]|nr:hypothetical protein [Phycisphaerae bacterium]